MVLQDHKDQQEMQVRLDHLDQMVVKAPKDPLEIPDSKDQQVLMETLDHKDHMDLMEM